jgi:hypothetical protein
LALSVGAGLGCTGADELGADSAYDTEATVFTELGVSTKEETAVVIVELFNEDLDTCSAAHPDITVITADNLAEFERIGSMFYMDMRGAIEAMMKELGKTEVTLDELRAQAPLWAPTVVRVDEQGRASWDAGDPLIVYTAIEISNERNAFARADNPTGIVLSELREQWRKVEGENNLDSSFVLPVVVSKEPTLNEIRKKLHGPWAEEIEFGFKAIEVFGSADEGPGGSTEFKPIADALKGSSIVKRWYFFSAGENWSHNTLVVLDEHSQMWGFSMGYSE